MKKSSKPKPVKKLLDSIVDGFSTKDTGNEVKQKWASSELVGPIIDELHRTRKDKTP